MTKFLILSLLGAVTSTFAQTVTLNQFLTDLQKLNTDYNRLDGIILAYDGSVGGFTPIIQVTNLILADFRNATRDIARVSPPPPPYRLNVSDSDRILNYIRQTLEPTIDKTSTDWVNTRSRYIPAVAGVIRRQLGYLRGNATLFGSAVNSRVPTSRTSAATVISAKITNDIARVQTAFAQ